MKVAPLRKAIEREPEADEPNVAATVGCTATYRIRRRPRAV